MDGVTQWLIVVTKKPRLARGLMKNMTGRRAGHALFGTLSARVPKF